MSNESHCKQQHSVDPAGLVLAALQLLRQVAASGAEPSIGTEPSICAVISQRLLQSLPAFVALPEPGPATAVVWDIVALHCARSVDGTAALVSFAGRSLGAVPAVLPCSAHGLWMAQRHSSRSLAALSVRLHLRVSHLGVSRCDSQ